VVSHELASIFSIADRVIMLDKQHKGIIAEGDPRHLVNHSTDVRVREFLGRGEDAKTAARKTQPSP
jgi:phospholipid/cholesterol/gamma-HCH transport system ATP-binding protein